MNKQKDIIKKENVVQAVVVADDFSDAFIPITNALPLVSIYQISSSKITIL